MSETTSVSTMNWTQHMVTTVRHKAGKCPACRAYLWADVDVRTTVSPPTISEDGKASVYSSANPIAMRVNHECGEVE